MACPKLPNTIAWRRRAQSTCKSTIQAILDAILYHEPPENNVERAVLGARLLESWLLLGVALLLLEETDPYHHGGSSPSEELKWSAWSGLRRSFTVNARLGMVFTVNAIPKPFGPNEHLL